MEGSIYVTEDKKTKPGKVAKLAQGTKQTSSVIYNKVIKKPAFRYLLVVLAIGLVGYGIFVAGEHRGAKRQAAIDEKKRTSLLTNRPGTQLNKLPNGQTRKSVFGTVTKVSDNSIDVKARTNNTTTTIAIDKNTIITGPDAKKTDAKALKNDQSVIVSGIADKSGNVTAQRIRIQK